MTEPTPFSCDANNVTPFPLMAWFFAPSEPAALRRMKECGLTLAGFSPVEHLDAVHKAGLKAIVRENPTPQYDWRNLDEAAFRKDVEKLVREANDHPATVGYFLKDEPHADEFAGLGKACEILRDLAPGKWPYINLFPNTVGRKGLGSVDYREHLETYISTCQPPILSYDHYALMETEPLRKGYYANLEIAREVALKHGIHFWNTVLSTGHFNYRVPNDADYRLQAYTTLAHGGCGISYFLYRAVPTGNYRMAPVDQFGNETPAWYWMQNVNLQVAQLAPTMRQLTSTRVYHLGSVPEGCAGPGLDRLVERIPFGDYLVGEFKHANGSDYVMLVNKNLSESVLCEPVLPVPLDKVRMISAYAGSEVAYHYPNRWLAPGQGVLLTW